MKFQIKAKRLLVVPAIAINSILATATITEASYLSRGYSQTCDNFGYNDRTGELFASCRTVTGDYQHSSINLNEYITNDDGNLVWRRPGNFVQSVKGCNIANSANNLTYLKCDEVRSLGGETFTVGIVLDKHIENVDGYLKYYE